MTSFPVSLSGTGDAADDVAGGISMHALADNSTVVVVSGRRVFAMNREGFVYGSCFAA